MPLNSAADGHRRYHVDLGDLRDHDCMWIGHDTLYDVEAVPGWEIKVVIVFQGTLSLVPAYVQTDDRTRAMGVH